MSESGTSPERTMRLYHRRVLRQPHVASRRRRLHYSRLLRRLLRRNIKATAQHCRPTSCRLYVAFPRSAIHLPWPPPRTSDNNYYMHSHSQASIRCTNRIPGTLTLDFGRQQIEIPLPTPMKVVERRRTPNHCICYTATIDCWGHWTLFR